MKYSSTLPGVQHLPAGHAGRNYGRKCLRVRPACWRVHRRDEDLTSTASGAVIRSTTHAHPNTPMCAQPQPQTRITRAHARAHNTDTRAQQNRAGQLEPNPCTYSLCGGADWASDTAVPSQTRSAPFVMKWIHRGARQTELSNVYSGCVAPSPSRA